MSPHILITNANIFGLEDYDSILIRDGVIRLFGNEDRILKECRGCHRVFDVDQRIVIPGLADAHMHLLSYALTKTRLDLRGVSSIEELKDKLRKFKGGISGWILGRSWDQELFDEKRMPTRYDLDEVIKDKPVFLIRVCGHVGVANSKALELAGIDKDTPDPIGGVIGRDEDGNPNGLLFENALEMMYRVIPEPSYYEKREAIISAINEALSYGLTELHLMSVDKNELEILFDDHISSLIRLRVYLRPNIAFQEGIDKRIHNFLRIEGIKVFMDGSFGARTALLRDSYSDSPKSRGQYILDYDGYSSIVSKAVNHGFKVATHAIGDAAVQTVIDYVGKNPEYKPFIRIEHASLTPPDLLSQLWSHQIPISVQPHFIITDWWIVDRLGSRARWVYAYRSMLERNIPIAGSSDAPVEPLNPWTGVYAAVDRGRSKNLPIWNVSSGEALDINDAIRVYINGKIMSGTFSRSRFYVGMPADLVVLDTRKLRVESLDNIRAYITIVGGFVRYSRYA